MANILLLTLFRPMKNYQISPPLGICYLSSALKMSGHQVLLIDLRAKQADLNDRLAEIKNFGPDIVGISALVLEHHQLEAGAKLLHALPTRPLICVGGPFANSLPDRLLSYPEVELVVQGEGERVLVEIANQVDQGSSDYAIPGVISRENTNSSTKSHLLVIEDLDQIPFPDWASLHLPDYHDQPHHGYLYYHKQYMSVITSRGCPYRCVFCHNIMGKKYRKRSPENIVDELEVLQNEYGIREITISDDVFNLDLDRAKAVCDLICDRDLKLKFTFPSGMRGDVMDLELLQKLKAIGTYKVAYGIESGSERIQKLIKKNVKLDKLRETIEMTSRLGIIVQGFFLFGFPTETKHDLAKTVSYCTQSKLDFASFNIVNAFPGTELHQMASDIGHQLDYQLDEYDYDTIGHQLSDLSTDDLRKLIRNLNFRFYFNPFRLIRIFHRIPRKLQMLGLAWYFVNKVFIWLRK